jgi:hypothetical protein
MNQTITNPYNFKSVFFKAKPMKSEQEARISKIPTNLANPSGKPTSLVPDKPALLPLALDNPAKRKATAKNSVITV